MFITLLLIWSGIALYWIFRRRYGDDLPGPKRYPLVGNAFMFLGNPKKTFETFSYFNKQFPRLAAIWLGPVLNVAVYNAENLEVIMKCSGKLEKGDEYKFLKPWLGDSILMSAGEKFRRHKKLIMPTFQTANLKLRVSIFNENADLLVENVKGYVGAGEVNVRPFISLCAIGGVLESVLGVKKERIGQGVELLADAIDKLEKFAHIRTFNIFLRPDIIFKFSKLKKMQDSYLTIVNDLADDIVAERRRLLRDINQEESETCERCSTFLDAFIEQNFSKQSIRDEVNFVLFAGQDTTTATVGFALSLLGIHQDVQEQVINELNGIFKGSNRPISYEDTQRMQYLEQVICETLRLYPPIPLIAKKLTDDIQLENHVLPKGCTLIVGIMLLHRDPKQFPEPNKFNPINFSPEKIKSRNPYSFMPFSAGNRSCVGQKHAMLQTKVMLATFLRNYQVFSQRKENDFVLSVQTILKIKGGFSISIQPRKPSCASL